MLSNDEKINIIDQHLRSLEHMLYNHELDLLQANAVTNKDQGFIDAINEKVLDINAKKNILIQEKETLLG